MARLIRSEKEVEGRYEEVWTLVEEDALDQWPAGPGDVVGRPTAAPRRPREGPRDARYTGDLQLPGTLARRAAAQPVRARRVKRIDLAAARLRPACSAVIGPGRGRRRGRGSELRGERGRRRRGGDVRAGRGGRSADRRRVGGARATPRRRRGGTAGLARRGARRTSAATTTRARGGRRGRRGRVPDADAEPQPARDAPVRLPVARRHARRYVSTQCIWGAGRISRGARAPAGQGPRHLRVHGRRLRREEGVDDSILLAAELAKRTGPPVRCASRAATRTSSAATATRRCSASPPARAPTAR